jgi:hypothetical protein
VSAAQTKRPWRDRPPHQGQPLRSTTDEHAIENERLRRQLKDRDKQVAADKKQIADLERQLALRDQNSTTSLKPPSSDGLAGRPRERGRRTKSRRQPGGKPVIPVIVVPCPA